MVEAKRILVTGSNGFVGRYLVEHFQTGAHQFIRGMSGHGQRGELASDQVILDVCDADAVEQVVAAIKPTHLIHLAAISNVPFSVDNPGLTWKTNVLGTVNVLNALSLFAPDCFALVVSSSEVYGGAFQSGQALSENAPCLPMNPYAASKRAAELAAEQFFRQGLKGAIARPFNHIGPGQSAGFATASFARQIALIEGGKQEPIIRVGNLEASRDFLDVEDVCRAYMKLIQASAEISPGTIYNIASGVPVNIGDILQRLLAMADVKIAVEIDSERLRPSDTPFAVGNAQRLKQAVGWAPTVSLENTLSRLLDDWREQDWAAFNPKS